MLNIEELQKRMCGQDTMATKDPIYMVQERWRVYGVSENYTDNHVWMCYGEEIAESEEEREEYVEANEVSPEQRDEIHKVGYLDLWINHQPFFSQKGAERYIAANRQNLKDPRIYVESAHRNDEWIAMRKVIFEENK
jgi:hypothetical protein